MFSKKKKNNNNNNNNLELIHRLLYGKPFREQLLVFNMCAVHLLKTLREKENLLVTRNASFPNSVFYRCGQFSPISIKL